MSSGRAIGWMGMLAALAGVAAGLSAAQMKGQAVETGPQGMLVYEADELGNRVPDFSHAGYGGGGVPIPHVAAVVRVAPGGGDDGARIQAAINHVSRLAPGSDGLRGAVLLEAGEYQVEGALSITAGGVVLRGAGSGAEGTRIVATGTGRRTLVHARGDGVRELCGWPVSLSHHYVPAGSRSVRVVDASGFSPGDRVLVRRPAVEDWIRELGMDTAPGRTPYRWKAGTIETEWERRIVSIDTNTLLLDAPLTTALDPAMGGAAVQRVRFPGRLRQCGLEGLRLVSAHDAGHPADEEHAWMAIEMDDLEDSWVRDVTGVHFVSSIVDLGPGTRAVTVMDCSALQPVSERAGYRRHSFHTSGQLGLFLRCHSQDGRNDFTAGYLAGGPNVFLHCRAEGSTGLSGSIGSWASGLLFDNVHIDGGSLALDNLEIRYGGVGWAAANSVLWQSSASRIVVRSPPGAANRAIGVWGEFLGDGRWYKVNEFVSPQSLYTAQLRERMGEAALAALEPFAPPPADGSVPLLESLHADWRRLLPGGGPAADPMAIRNGWIVDSRGLMTGRQAPSSWWRGHLLPGRTAEHPPAITRFLPGRYGAGATEDLGQLAAGMVERNEIQHRHHWGLWYDRRREDHQMVRRADADVWPPFFEQPFARSGQGAAWDGLSRYDLARFNPWYFQRLRDFAAIAATRGRILVNEMFFQHNIIESGAHWVDFPWRPVNNIQDTRFPEPPPFTGDTIRIGNQFYDTGQDWLRAIHTRYIRHSLDNLAGQPNVIHTTGDEFTGPLAFVQYWLDTVGEWVGEGNPDPVIALSATKDVQDAILTNPARSSLVDVVEIKYWFRTQAGLYAPAGGGELAPRQHLRKWKGGQSTPRDVANMVRDYRLAFPGKAVICSEIGGLDGWAIVAGGGSLAPLPAGLEPELRMAIPRLGVVDVTKGDRDRVWILGAAGCYLVHAEPGARPVLDLDGQPGAFTLREIDRRSGRFLADSVSITGGGSTGLPVKEGDWGLYWITPTERESQ